MSLKLCRLCLETCNKNFQKVDEITAEIMNIVLVKPNLRNVEHPYVCCQCSEILQKCFHFKSTCFYTEEFLSSFIKKEDNQDIKIDLKELYLTTQGLTELKIPTYQKICRFCMELVTDGNLIPLEDVDVYMLQKCLPELSFLPTKEPVICDACHTFLKSYTSFVDGCVQTDEKIAKYREVKRRGKLSLISVRKFCEENEFFDDKTLSGFEIVDVPDTKPVKPEKIHYMECLLKVDKDIEDGKIKYKNKRRRILKYHYTEEEIKRKKYVCTECPYRTNCRKVLNKHVLIHADPSELEWFDCDVCTYKTINKSHLTRHSKIHYKGPKNIVFKKCPLCDYRARFSCVLRAHMEVHADPSTLKMYSCKYCPYKTRFKAGVASHMRKHSIKCTHRCPICQFETKYVESYRRHMVRHADPSKLEYLHCADCDFKTTRKAQLNIHIKRAHMDPSKVSMYRCEECNFSTFYKSDHTRHMLRHKDRSKVTVYRCELCTYETVYIKQFKGHKLVHTDPSEMDMHECKLCPFKTKRRESIKSHMLKHKKASELNLFECGECGQTFKSKCNMRAHILKHQVRKNKSSKKA